MVNIDNINVEDSVDLLKKELFYIMNSEKISDGILTISFSWIDGDMSSQRWDVKKQSEKLFFGINKNQNKKFPDNFKEMLRCCESVVVVFRGFTDQKHHVTKYPIKEIWAMLFVSDGKNTVQLQKLQSKEVYDCFTKDSITGKDLLPEQDVMYCGIDGKICGWDMM